MSRFSWALQYNWWTNESQVSLAIEIIHHGVWHKRFLDECQHLTKYTLTPPQPNINPNLLSVDCLVKGGVVV